MRIVVCLRQAVSGELNPFDACAYEAALRIADGEVILLSMAAPKSAGFLTELTRLGAKRAILLSDKGFAGADTLATAYALSLAIGKLQPDLVLCGRQTVDGDTGQVGPETSVLAKLQLVTNVMKMDATDQGVTCVDRDGRTQKASYPALLTVERIHTLRLPSLRSKKVETEIWTAADLGADLARCGSIGSPTKVMKTFENEQDRRKCTFIAPAALQDAIAHGLAKGKARIAVEKSSVLLKKVWIAGESPHQMAQSVSEDIRVLPMTTAEEMAEAIRKGKPNAVLWGSDRESKKIAAQVAAILQIGLCADCTALETDGETLFMYRPAFSGNIIAKIRSVTLPQMATVRTLQPDTAPIVVGVGAGVKGCLQEALHFAEKLGADVAASRVMVDQDYMPYERQVGLTGKSVNPDVYIALGISGAVHHIAGMRSSGTVIAVNPDKNAPIFNYADYGIVCNAEELF